MPGRNGVHVRGQIIRVLPAATAFQTLRTAAKLDFDVSNVLTIVANAVTLSAWSPRGQKRTLRDNPDLIRPAPAWGSTWPISENEPHGRVFAWLARLDG